MRIQPIAASFFLASAFPAAAQFEFETGIDPSAIYGAAKSTGASVSSIEPYAMALSEELLEAKATSYWDILGISSSSAASEFNQQLRRGMGRTEIAALILMAESSKNKLSELVKLRVEKKGMRLKAIAEKFSLNYEDVSSRAKALRDRCLAAAKLKKWENENNGDKSGEPAASSSTRRAVP